MNRDKLPIAWVAHANGQLLGTAALRVHDLQGREDLTPWLGGVFVGSHFRRHGIGAALCATVEAEARSRGIQTLYLFTLDKQAWYSRLGWTELAPCVWHQRTCLTAPYGFATWLISTAYKRWDTIRIFGQTEAS